MPTRPPPGPVTIAQLRTSVAIGSMGLAGGGLAAGLLAYDLTHSEALVGAPVGISVAGAAVAALALRRTAAQRGRIAGLVVGYRIGALGAALMVLAASVHSLPLVLAASLPLGFANTSVFLSRYATGEVRGSGEVRGAGLAPSGRAVGSVVGVTTIGAVVSPNLLGPGEWVADPAGLPGPTGLIVISGGCFAVAAAVLRTHDRGAHELGMHDRGAHESLGVPDSRRRRWLPGPSGRAAVVRRWTPSYPALCTLAAANGAMVAAMAVAPASLEHENHLAGTIGAVVSVHVLGMFAPGALTGALADRVGGRAVAAGGMGLIGAATVAGPFIPVDHAVAFGLHLFTLGLGWNAAVVGASALLVVAFPAPDRVHGEAVGEVAMGAAAAVAAPTAGIVAAIGGYGAVSGAACAVTLAGAILMTIGDRHTLGAAPYESTQHQPEQEEMT